SDAGRRARIIGVVGEPRDALEVRRDRLVGGAGHRVADDRVLVDAVGAAGLAEFDAELFGLRDREAVVLDEHEGGDAFDLLAERSGLGVLCFFVHVLSPVPLWLNGRRSSRCARLWRGCAGGSRPLHRSLTSSWATGRSAVRASSPPPRLAAPFAERVGHLRSVDRRLSRAGVPAPRTNGCGRFGYFTLRWWASSVGLLVASE